MNLKTLCLAGLAALTLAACGGNTICADQAAATTALTGTKLAACPSLKATVAAAEPTLTTDQCTTALSSCSSDDQTKLTSMITCFNAIGNCPSDADSSAWLLSLVACSKSGVCATSAACYTAFGVASSCSALNQ
jgi:hypothetical protein